jgi:hypothetical protein
VLLCHERGESPINDHLGALSTAGASDPIYRSAYRFPSFGFRVCSNEARTSRVIDRLLQGFRSEGSADDATYVLDHHHSGRNPFALYVDDLCIQEPVHAASMVDFVLSDATTRAIEATRGFLVVHAGAVSWAGRGILLPAPPDSGKTTLTAGLTRAGFSYLTDEAALIDPSTHLLHPFARPVAMDPEALDLIPGLRDTLPLEYRDLMRYQYHFCAEDLRPGSEGGPCPIEFIIVPSYAHSIETRMVKISPGLTVKLLAENAFNFAKFGSEGLGLVADVVRHARCYRLEIGDLDEAVAAVADAADARRLAPASPLISS